MMMKKYSYTNEDHYDYRHDKKLMMPIMTRTIIIILTIQQQQQKQQR